jgi:hypothetical protein
MFAMTLLFRLAELLCNGPLCLTLPLPFTDCLVVYYLCLQVT